MLTDDWGLCCPLHRLLFLRVCLPHFIIALSPVSGKWMTRGSRQVHGWCPRRNGSVLSQLSPFIPLSITDYSFHPALLKVSWFADSEWKRGNDQKATKIKGGRVHQWVHQRNVSFLYLVGLTWVALASFNLGGRKTARVLGPRGIGFATPDWLFSAIYLAPGWRSGSIS